MPKSGKGLLARYAEGVNTPSPVFSTWVGRALGSTGTENTHVPGSPVIGNFKGYLVSHGLSFLPCKM